MSCDLEPPCLLHKMMSLGLQALSEKKLLKYLALFLFDRTQELWLSNYRRQETSLKNMVYIYIQPQYHGRFAVGDVQAIAAPPNFWWGHL